MARRNKDSNVLYTNKELLFHIESMGSKFLYIFSFLWGGLLYLYITNPKSDFFMVFETKIDVLVTAFASELNLELFYLIPLLSLFSFMGLTLISLIVVIFDRDIPLKKKDESLFILRKEKQLRESILIGSIISLCIIYFMILFFISSAKTLSESLILISKIILQLAVFTGFIYIPFRKIAKINMDLMEIDNLFRKKRDITIKLISNRFIKFCKFINLGLGFLLSLVWLSLKKGYWLIMGVFLYVQYILFTFFGMLQKGLMPIVFIVVFLIFFILFAIRTYNVFKGKETLF